MGETDVYLERFEGRARAEAPWLMGLRERAFSRFAEMGFPTTRLEDWKYTDVAPLARTRFEPGAGVESTAPSEVAPGLRLAGTVELVFVNGRYDDRLSCIEGLPAGVRIRSLAAVLGGGAGELEPHLARHAAYEEQSFTALNTAFMDDGAVIEVAAGATLARPIHLVFLSRANGAPVISHPRNLVIAGAGSQASIIETYSGGEGQTYCTNTVSEIVLGPGAALDHYKIQREGNAAFHIGTVSISQGPSSRLWSSAISIGGLLSRSEISTLLDAEDSECTLDGLYLASEQQHVDHHTSIDHRKPRCSSRELYKGVLDGQATGVFNGKVFVRPDAQQSDAAQVNKNLLLSDDATVDTKPQLEIFADDVKCSHGATIGRLDQNALFYLRTRGIDAAEGRRLLIHAFAGEIIQRMKVEPLRMQLEHMLAQRFGGTRDEIRR
jgi:Fe-S cluster assembly protein SufD